MLQVELNQDRVRSISKQLFGLLTAQTGENVDEVCDRLGFEHDIEIIYTVDKE